MPLTLGTMITWAHRPREPIGVGSVEGDCGLVWLLGSVRIPLRSMRTSTDTPPSVEVEVIT